MSSTPRIQEITFLAEFDKLPAVFEWIRQCCKEAYLEGKETRRAELALEEVLVNVVRYAYPEHKGEVHLTCELYPGDRLMFIVKDRGIPFNPILQKPRTDPLAELEEREEGGLGILFTQNLMDLIDYQRDGPFNVLFLTKKL